MRNYTLLILCCSFVFGSCTLLFSSQDSAVEVQDASILDSSSPPPVDPDSSPSLDAGLDATVSIVPMGVPRSSPQVGDSMSGDLFAPITCPDSSVLYGLRASSYFYGTDGDTNTVTYLCRLQALCTNLQVVGDARVTRTNSLVQPAMGVGNCAVGTNVMTTISPLIETLCPGQSVAIGIILNTDNNNSTLFSQARLQCANVNSNGMLSPSMDSPNLGTLTPIAMGQKLESSCPDGAAATQVHARGEESINQVFLSCSALADN